MKADAARPDTGSGVGATAGAAAAQPNPSVKDQAPAAQPSWSDPPRTRLDRDDVSEDDRDVGWGESPRPPGRDDDWYRSERPPHHD